MTLPTTAECARWYAQAFDRGAVVMIDPDAGATPEGVARSTTVDALTTLRWLSRPAHPAPPLLALQTDGAAALVLHQGADPLTGDVHIGRLSEENPPPREQLAALGLAAEPEGDGAAVVAQDALASALAFAVVADGEAPGQDGERPPAPDPDELPLDIYDSRFIGLATAFGAPLEAIWHQFWEFSGVRWCLLNADLDVEDVDRIPYRQALPAGEFVRALRACNDAGLHYLTLPVCVTTAPGRGHVIHLETVGDEEVVYHDPWPGRSLLAAGNNAFGVAARPWEGPARRWCITRDELARVAYASLVEPAAWLPLCGVATDVRYGDLVDSDFFGFFHFTETGRAAGDDDAGLVQVHLEPGNWQEHIDVDVTVDVDDAVRAATLTIDRSWLSAPQTAMFAFDLLASFIGAAVTEADADEADLLRDALRSMPTGGVVEQLAAGPPHLLNHFRLIAMTVGGAAPFARATLPCSTVRVLNGTPKGADGGEPRLIVVVSRPVDEPGALVEDHRTGYFMDEYRAYLWEDSRDAREQMARGSAPPG